MKIFKIVRILLVVISVVTFVHFLEMATDECGISGSEDETTFWYVCIWIVTGLSFVFKKKIEKLLERFL